MSLKALHLEAKLFFWLLLQFLEDPHTIYKMLIFRQVFHQLTHVPSFLVSRSKIALRRRKRKNKKLPLSQEKRAEMRIFKTRHQLQKEAEIKERLEHRPNINKNINEMIEQMYFPDLRMQDSMAAMDSFKIENLQASAELQNLISKAQFKKSLMSNLNSQLLAAYTNHKDQMDIEAFSIMFSKIRKNSANLDEIKKKRLQQWQKHIQKLRLKSVELPQPLKFYDSRDVQLHPTWKQLLFHLQQVIQSTPPEKLNQLIEMCFKYIHTFNLIPHNLLFLVAQKCMKSLDTLTIDVKTNLLKLLMNDNKCRRPSSIDLTNIAQERSKLNNFLHKVAYTVLQSPDMTAQSLIALISLIKQNKIQIKNMQQLVPPITRHLSAINFQNTINILMLNHKRRFLDQPLTQIILFDIYRKIPTCRKNRSIIQLLKIINNQTIKFGQLIIPVHHLLQPISEFIIQQLMKHAFSANQLILIQQKAYFNNLHAATLHQLISIQLTRQYKQLSLQSLFNSIFLLTLLNINCSKLTKLAFDRATKEYQPLMKSYKQSRTKYLPSKATTISPSQPSKQQVSLQTSLIMFIHCYTDADLDALLKIYPTNILSRHLLVYQLCQNIEQRLKKYGMFPRMHYSFTIQQHSLDKFYLPTTDPIKQALHLQSVINGQFYHNYHLSQHYFIQQPWSITTITPQQYLQWLNKHPKDDQFFFGKPGNWTAELQQKISQLRKSITMNSSQPVDKQVERYELSEED